MKFPPILHSWFPTILGSAHSDTEDKIDRMFGASRLTTAGEPISPETAKRISTYFACIKNISEDIGKLPWLLLRIEKDGKVRATDLPLFRILHRAPNPAMIPFEFRRTLEDYKQTWGNGIAEIVRNGFGDVVAMWPIHPTRYEKIWLDGNTGVIMYKIRNANQHGGAGIGSVILRGDQVYHIKGPGDGITGISAAHHGKQSLGLAAAQQTFAAAFYGNGATISGVLEHDGQLDNERAEVLKRSWQQGHGGPYSAHKTAVLEDGIKWKQVSMPMTDAQFLESRRFSVVDIARWFRMPPHKVQELGDTTFNNIEASNIDYVVDCLGAPMIQWEQEAIKKLVPEDQQDDLLAELDEKALLRGDQKARGDFYRRLFNIGALSPNEALALESMPGIGPPGDTHYVPVNVVPVGTPVGNMAGAAGADTDQGTNQALPAATTPLERIEPFKRILKAEAVRMVRKEVWAAKHHAKKTDAEFEKAMTKFYQGHHELIVGSLIPVTTSIYETLKCKVGPTPFLTVLADELCESGLSALRKARESKVVNEVCDSWTENKVHTIMQRVIASALPMD